MFLVDSPQPASKSRRELVLDKICPPSVLPTVSRSRLLKLLNQSFRSCTSTIISGRAGAGKTSVAIDFASKCGRPFVWYKVDAPESELRIFFHYLVASIRRQRPRFATGALGKLIEIADCHHIPLLAEAFVYELAETDNSPLLIVIEDVHLVCDAPWLAPFFRRLLPLLPSQTHILITSRTLPGPLWRMRSKQILTVIDEETLAFSKLEAAELFERYGLSAEQSSIAVDHTRGRAASLVSLVMRLRESELRTPNASSEMVSVVHVGLERSLRGEP